MRLVFIGASKFGLRCLKKAISLPDCEVVGIITNPATFPISYRPDGVRNVLHADFRPAAERHGIPIWVMKGKMNDPALLYQLKSWRPDLILVVGWYHMIPKAIRNLAPTAGLHASLLPDYSGGAPLVWAMIHGEEKTGISFFMMEEEVDSGDLIGQAEERIFLNDTIATLYGRIEEAGIRLLEKHIPRLARGEATLTRQNHIRRRLMPQRRPEDGLIDWSWPSLGIYNFIRAQTAPYPGAFTFLDGEKITIWEAKLFDPPAAPSNGDLEGGEVLKIISSDPLEGILVAGGGGDHPLVLTVVGTEENRRLSGLELAVTRDVMARKTQLGRR